MQTEERKQFHLNPQVLVMVAVIFLAMALPLAAVIGFAVGTYRIRQEAAQPEPSPEAQAALQKSLEDVAQKNLAPQSLNESTVEIVTENVHAKREQVVKLAEAMGGSAMVMADDKVWAQVPDDRVGVFKQACEGSEIPPTGEKTPGASLTLVEVLIKPKSS